MKKIIPSILFVASTSPSLLLAQVNSKTVENQVTGYRLQATGSRKIAPLLEYSSVPISNLPSSISYLSIMPKLMMDQSSAEEGIKAVKKTFETSEQNAVAAEGTVLEHQVVGVAAEIKETPLVSVSAESNKVATQSFSNASPQILKSGKEKENSEEFQDPDFELRNNTPITTQVNKYIKNEIINNIYTECLAEAAKLSLGTRVTEGNQMTAAQRVAKRELEFDQKIAEEALAKAKKTELTANVAKGKTHEMNFERELKAYHDAEEAWMEAVEGFKTARAKAQEADLNDEEQAVALASAEVRQATWRAHSRWAKARKADQVIASSGDSLDHLIATEAAWTNAVEGYKMAIAKATEAHVKCGELTTALHYAASVQEKVAAQVQAQLMALVTTKVIQLTEQAAIAKEASVASKQEDRRTWWTSNAWDYVVAGLEEATRNWNKVSETLIQGNRARASLWKKAAEQSEASAEEWKHVAQAYVLGDEVTERTARIAACLSDAALCVVQFEEALAEGKELLAVVWNKKAMVYQKSAEYYRKSAEAELSGDNTEAERWERATFSTGGIIDALNQAAEALEKATSTTAEGKQSQTTFWNKLAIQYQESAEYSRKATKAELQENNTEAERWEWVASFITNYSAWGLKAAAEALEEVGIATAAGNKPLAELWNKAATQYQESFTYSNKAIEAKLSGNNAEAERLGKIVGPALQNSENLRSAAEAFAKATIATVGENKPLAELWSKTAQQYQEASEYYCRSVVAMTNGNITEGDLLCEVAAYAKKSAEYLGNLQDESISAVGALEKVALAAAKGNKPLVELCSKKVTQYQELAEFYRTAAEAVASGNNAEADRWEKADHYAQEAFGQLILADGSLRKAINEENQPLVELFSKTVMQFQELVSFYQKAIEVALSEHAIDDIQWEKVDEVASESESQLNQAHSAICTATTATTDGNQSLAELCSKTATQYQESAGHYLKAAEAHLVGNIAEADQWEEAASSAKERADALMQEAEEF